MGLFQSKKSKRKKLQEDAAAHEVEHFFDEYFREELRNHGRWYFEKVISENGTLFKQDLDSTLSDLNTDLKEHATRQLDDALKRIDTELKEYITSRIDEQIAGYTKATKDAQDSALQAMTSSSESLQQKHRELSDTMQRTAAEHEQMFKGAFEDSKAKIEEMKDAQSHSLELLKSNVDSLQKQHQEISDTLRKNLEAQQQALVTAFQENMASIVEHHLLDAVGEQYDLKDQLPSIIQQMEESKQAIVDDMKI